MSRSPVGPECAYCGKGYLFMKDGRVPTHDWPPPCRQVCPGSKMPPREPGAVLEKDQKFDVSRSPVGGPAPRVFEGVLLEWHDSRTQADHMIIPSLRGELRLPAHRVRRSLFGGLHQPRCRFRVRRTGSLADPAARRAVSNREGFMTAVESWKLHRWREAFACSSCGAAHCMLRVRWAYPLVLLCSQCLAVADLVRGRGSR